MGSAYDRSPCPVESESSRTVESAGKKAEVKAWQNGWQQLEQGKVAERSAEFERVL